MSWLARDGQSLKPSKPHGIEPMRHSHSATAHGRLRASILGRLAARLANRRGWLKSGPGLLRRAYQRREGTSARDVILSGAVADAIWFT